MTGIRDNEDRMVALLEKIASNTGGGITEEQTVTQNVEYEGQTADGRVGVIPKGSYQTVETDGMDGMEDGETITLQPGESAPLIYHDRPCMLYAIGATDVSGVSYELRIDGRAVGGRTNSPLGTIGTPFSFVNTLGGVLGVENKVEYVAHNPADNTGQVELAARLHLEAVA